MAYGEAKEEIDGYTGRRPRALTTCRQCWTVATEADIEQVATRINEQFVQIALPYIAKYSDLEAAYGVLSSMSMMRRSTAPSFNRKR